MKNASLFAGAVLLGLSLASAASAASISVTADPTSVRVGDAVTLTVTIDTEGTAVNAAQAAIQLSPELLEITGVESADSIFNFWADGPSFFADTGRIDFLGGATNGFNGQSLRVLRVTSKARAEGIARIDFADATIAANDGSGTDVLTAMHGASVTVAAVPVPEAPPEQIVREPVQAELPPSIPELEIPLYPDPAAWYNTVSPFIVKWDLPDDISDVSTAVNQIPEFDPKASEGLFDNKIFRLPGDGIWYLHVRFKNNVGWGETKNVRLAVDTIPPAVFQTGVDPAMVTDVPTPVISFESSDQLSGLRGYSVQVDDTPAVQTAEKTYAIAALPPGKHVVRVDAHDQAGNSTNTTVEITTLPIASPTVSPLSETVYAGEGGLTVGGTAMPGVRLTVELRRSTGELIGTSLAVSNEKGVWNTRFDQPLRAGNYAFAVIATDDRGATSIPARMVFAVVNRPFLTLLGVEISQVWFYSVILVLLAIGFGIGWEVQRRKKQRRGWHIVIAQRDVGSAFDQIEGDLEAMVKRHGKKPLTERDAEEMQQVMQRLDERIHRVRQYILDNIEEINA